MANPAAFSEADVKGLEQAALELTAMRTVLERTQVWLERAVIGLNLCPFAKAVHAKGQIRYVASTATTTPELLFCLEKELNNLLVPVDNEYDTTLIVVTGFLNDFLDFNAFLQEANRLIKRMKLRGVFQMASFHPHYQFADSSGDDMANYSNRSPYPTLHLLREASVDKAVAAFPAADQIFEQNKTNLRQLGLAGWAALGINS